jgi:hypothetical protein
MATRDRGIRWFHGRPSAAEHDRVVTLEALELDIDQMSAAV